MADLRHPWPFFRRTFLYRLPLTAFMCMGFGAKHRQTALWMTGSLTVWTAVSAVAAYYGFSFLAPENEGLLKNIFKQEE